MDEMEFSEDRAVADVSPEAVVFVQHGLVGPG